MPKKPADRAAKERGTLDRFASRYRVQGEGRRPGADARGHDNAPLLPEGRDRNQALRRA